MNELAKAIVGGAESDAFEEATAVFAGDYAHGD